MSTTLTMSPQGQITIPVELRKLLDLKPGSRLILDVVDWVKEKVMVLQRRPKSLSSYTLGLGKNSWWGVDPVKYIREERNSWDK